MSLPPSSSSSAVTGKPSGGRGGLSPSRTFSSSSPSVSRSGSDTSSSRATVTNSENISMATDREGVSKMSSSSSRQHHPLPLVSGERARREVSASLASAGGESSDTSSIPGSSESVQSSLTEITAEIPVPDHVQMVGMAEQNGIPTAPVSLFHDPLIFYSSNTSAAMQGGEGAGSMYDASENDVTLDIFPALRPNTAAATEIGKRAANNVVLPPPPPPLCNESIAKGDVDLASTRDIVEAKTAADTLNRKREDEEEEEEVSATEAEGEKKTTTPHAATTRQAVEDAELLHAEHNRYRSVKSSARPENWPDVQGPPPRAAAAAGNNNNNSGSGSSSSGKVEEQAECDNHRGQRDSPPHSLGSSSGFTVEAMEESQGKGGVASNDDITAKVETTGSEEKPSSTAETSSAQPTTDKAQTDQKTEPDHPPVPPQSPAGNKTTAVTKGDGNHENQLSQSPPETGASPPLTRRDSLDVNAKEFTPRTAILRPDSRPSSATYPSGLNPNAAAVYPYITNGRLPVLATVPPPAQMVNPLPTVPPPAQMVNNPLPTVPGVVAGGGALPATRRKMKGPGQQMAEPSSSNAPPSNTIPYVSLHLATRSLT